MKKAVCALLISSLIGIYSSANAQQCNPSGMDLDSIISTPQETVKWCWAASSQMVMDFHGRIESQCFLVDVTNRDNLDALGIPTCCAGNAYSDACFTGGWPTTPLNSFFYRYDLRRVVEDGDSPPTWAEITEQICQKRPFIFAIQWAGGGKHTFVVKGYAIDSDGEQVLHIYDHIGNLSADITYEQFLHGLQEGDQNYRDYLNIRPRE